MSTEQVVWKLKHVPTGEYAKNSLSKFSEEHTTLYLSVLGKVFLRKPKVPDVRIKYWGHTEHSKGWAEVSDWVLEEYHLVLQ